MIGVRLQLGDPVAQLRHLKKLAVLLHLHRAHPEDVGDQPTKAAQHHGGESQRRRQILDLLGVRQFFFRTELVHPALAEIDSKQEGQGQ